MKKKLILLFLISFIGINFVSAQFVTNADIGRTEISLNKRGWTPSTRSLTSISTPTLAQSGSTIYIYSPATLTNLRVNILDLSGNIIYSSWITITAGSEYSYPLYNIEEGEYEIELVYGKKYLTGYFSIDK